MTDSTPLARHGGDAASTVPPASRRPLLRYGVPSIVGLGTAALLAVAAGDVLRPVVPVTVHAVVYDPSASDAALSGPVRSSIPVAFQGDPASDDTSPPAAAGGRFVGPNRGASVQAPGWLEADPFVIAVSALADGVVDEMLVLEGEPVERGQVIARLVPDDAELALARAEAHVMDAEAALAEREAAAAAARTDWDEPVALERELGVSRGRLAEFEARLLQLPAQVAGARATHERLLEELDLIREARDAGAATDFEVVILEKNAETQAQAVRSLELSEAIIAAAVAEQSAAVRAAERALALRVVERRARDMTAAAVGRARAEVRRAAVARDEAALRLDRMTVRAPIDGFVQARIKGPGDKVMFGMDTPDSAHLVHLYDPAKIQVRVDVPLADASRLFVGQICEVVVEVLPGTTFRGEVTRITHQADLQKNTLQAKVRVLDPSPLLRPEMLTRVKFLGQERPARPPAGAEAPGAGAIGGATAPAADVDAVVLRIPRSTLGPGSDSVEGTVTVWRVSQRRGLRGVLEPVTLQAEAGLDLGGDELVPVSGDLRPGDLLADASDPNADRFTAGLRVRMRTGGSVTPVVAGFGGAR